ncbi:MAG: M23 family metallopeptidase [Bacteroidia bacterium]|nr:M23 family metallopeptidase [Bacteroidia bacterium]MDW8089512.1 M23 family metallopeptidase [Bacteroidia bacterium]
MIGAWIALQFLWPLPGPITLTGSYGEVRGELFHTGIDLGVGERLGTVPVLAAGKGYVSRIRVSHKGFGKVLYVSHPEGYTTVYGHLSHFAPRGEALVESLQTQAQRFEVEKYLKPGEWPVAPGETLGWAGNSGYSFGPHLHFEVRTKDQKPLCPLLYLPPLRDTIPPVFLRLAVRALTPSSHIEGWGGLRLLSFFQLRCQASQRLYVCRETLRVGGAIGLECSAADRQAPTSAWLGLARLTLKDTKGLVLFQARWETLDFDWHRFLRWYRDYPFQQIYRVGLARLYELPPQATVPWTQGKGILLIPPDSLVTVVLEAQDFGGNTAQIRLTLRGDKPKESLAPRRPLDPKSLWSIEDGLLLANRPLRLPWGAIVRPETPLPLGGQLPDTLYDESGRGRPTYLRAYLRPGCRDTLTLSPECQLYFFEGNIGDTLYFRAIPLETPYGPGWLLGDPYVPLRFPASLRWRVAGRPQAYPLLRPWNGGTWSPITEARRYGDVWHIPFTTAGAYVMYEDTVPPTIRPLKRAGPFYLVAIQDLGSGVAAHTIQVRSEKRKLFPEYYEPQAILYLPVKEGRRFWIEASDRVGNRTQRLVHF